LPSIQILISFYNIDLLLPPLKIHMKKLLFAIVLASSFVTAMSQDDDQPQDTAWKRLYRATATRINDLVHTKLDVSFDYDKAWMYGKEWVTLHPHFYPTDSLTLDAKGMEIKEIALVKGNSKLPLKYSYDSMQLQIKLDKTYKAGENYTIYINYVSRPNELKEQGSAAITDAKGLYFINPKGEDKDKPIEIWTQGETESNSAWFPTIDKPNQKTTEEIAMTVPSKYVTLSNGLLKSQ
jgi:aminopeptidase N